LYLIFALNIALELHKDAQVCLIFNNIPGEMVFFLGMEVKQNSLYWF